MNGGDPYAAQLTLTSDTEVVRTRAFHAPRELVFEALTHCRHLQRWFGGRRAQLTTCELDLRPGGSLRFVQQDGDGTVHPFRGRFEEVTAPSKLVYSLIYDVARWRGYEIRVTTRLAETGGATVLTNVTAFASRTERDAYLASGIEPVAGEGYDRLAELLAVETTPASADEVVVARLLDAPIDVAFAAWTDPRQLAYWWGPAGAAVETRSLDLQPGGAFHYGIRQAAGEVRWAKLSYREIQPPERLVYVAASEEPNGGDGPGSAAETATGTATGSGAWAEVLTTLSLFDSGGRTMLIVRARPRGTTRTRAPGATDPARETVAQELAATLERLARHLASR